MHPRVQESKQLVLARANIPYWPAMDQNAHPRRRSWREERDGGSSASVLCGLLSMKFVWQDLREYQSDARFHLASGACDMTGDMCLGVS